MAPNAENLQVLAPVIRSIAVHMMNVEHQVFCVVAAGAAFRPQQVQCSASVGRRRDLSLVVIRLDACDSYMNLLRVVLARSLAEAKPAARRVRRARFRPERLTACWIRTDELSLVLSRRSAALSRTRLSALGLIGRHPDAAPAVADDLEEGPHLTVVDSRPLLTHASSIGTDGRLRNDVANAAFSY